jgi:hypothetical protein
MIVRQNNEITILLVNELIYINIFYVSMKKFGTYHMIGICFFCMQDPNIFHRVNTRFNIFMNGIEKHIQCITLPQYW